jgi:Cu+-exporting ATPase
MTKVNDPVCTMKLDSATAHYRTTFQDQDFFFCSVVCMERFLRNPGHYFISEAGLTASPNRQAPT